MPSLDGMYTNLGGGLWANNSTQYRYNGTTYDLELNNTQGTLLASAARTANTVSPIQTNYNARGVLVFLDVTVVGASGGLQVQIRAKDPVTSKNINLNATPTAITALGIYAFEIYPGISGTGTGSTYVVQSTSSILPRSFDVAVLHVDGTSYTYSVGHALIL